MSKKNHDKPKRIRHCTWCGTEIDKGRLCIDPLPCQQYLDRLRLARHIARTRAYSERLLTLTPAAVAAWVGHDGPWPMVEHVVRKGAAARNTARSRAKIEIDPLAMRRLVDVLTNDYGTMFTQIKDQLLEAGRKMAAPLPEPRRPPMHFVTPRSSR